MKVIITTLLVALLASFPVRAAWELDAEKSALTFVSTKATNIAEVHRFTDLSGAMDGEGEVTIKIGLGSVDTGIEIRDDRMRDMLFDTGHYENATLVADVDLERLDELGLGQSMELTIEGILSLHGESATLNIEVIVARLSSSTLLVTSKRLVVVNALAFKLAEGVEALRKIAGLPSISLAVPVSFVLEFEAS
mgnify:CR=1 FL=1